ncbi:MAG: CUAEP/CCAEP-tail radical SAM protein [Dehalococcoidia bacterium]
MTRVLLISTYEQGHQPLGLAAAAAALRRSGHEVRCLDLAVESPGVGVFADTDLIAISVPMHTAARLGVALAKQLRPLYPAAHLSLYGLYASELHAHLTASGDVDSVIGGEYEIGLCALADSLARGRHRCISRLPGIGPDPAFDRQRYPLPDRSGLPPLDRYAQLETESELRLAGYVEASRGCAHRCRHCPLTPTYGGRLRLVQPEVVLADIDNLVRIGAQHITLGDPDLFNAVGHSLGILEAMHGRYPALTFDATIKVEHLLQHAPLLPRLRELGCVFITSAFESLDDALLSLLDKGHTAADLVRVLALAQRSSLVIRPTWLPFTPWTSLRDFRAILEFIEAHDLVYHVQPVQYALRLLLPSGSPLVDVIRADGLLTGFDADGLTHLWRNPDPSVDSLQERLVAIVASGAQEDEAWTFARVKAETLATIGCVEPPGPPPAGRRRVPRLTEAWFC